MAGLFGFFDYTKPGKGVRKDEQESRTKIFFSVLYRRFWKLMQLNLIYIVCSLPLIGGMLLFYPMPGGDSREQILAGFSFSILCLLYLSVIGLAPVITGFTYVLRNFSRQQHSWVFSDFFEQIKKNFKQAIIILVIDLAATYLIYVNYVFYASSEGTNLLLMVGRVFSVIASLLYFMMHFYLYPILVTFEMKLSQIYRNALLLTLGYLPRTIGIFLIVGAIAVAAFSSTATFGILVSVFIGVSLIGYIINFLVEPIIAKHLMQPSSSEEEV